MIGKLLATLTEGILDAVDLTCAVTTDAIKAPVRLIGKLDETWYFGEFTDDTRQAIRNIKERE